MKIKTSKKIGTDPLIFLAAGVIFTIFFNLIVNNDPFKIDSDSISSIANVGTFVVALTAALQVKKWLFTKKKETGFNHTVKILEIIEKSHEDIDPLMKQCDNIQVITSLYGAVVLTNDEKKTLQENINKVDLFCDRLVMSLSMLKYWDMKISDDSRQKLHEFTKSLRKANRILNNMVSFPKNIEEQIKKVDEIHKNAFENINSFLDFSYDDIFITKHTTSPLDKVD